MTSIDSVNDSGVFTCILHVLHVFGLVSNHLRHIDNFPPTYLPKAISCEEEITVPAVPTADCTSNWGRGSPSCPKDDGDG